MIRLHSLLSTFVLGFACLNVSACKAADSEPAENVRSASAMDSAGPKSGPSSPRLENGEEATVGDEFESYAESVARNLIDTLGVQETYAMLGWQQNPDYQPMQHCFNYWHGKEAHKITSTQVEDCELHVNDLSRLYASYGVDANPVVFKSDYYWQQNDAFYPVWLERVEAWKAAGGSKENDSFLDHPVCAKPLQTGWTGSEYFYDGREHPICNTYKIEALEEAASEAASDIR